MRECDYPVGASVLCLSPPLVALLLTRLAIRSGKTVAKAVLLVLPDVVQRVVALFEAKLILTPADLLEQSNVCGRDLGLAHLVCFVFMKHRSHVGHMGDASAAGT